MRGIELPLWQEARRYVVNWDKAMLVWNNDVVAPLKGAQVLSWPLDAVRLPSGCRIGSWRIQTGPDGVRSTP